MMKGERKGEEHAKFVQAKGGVFSPPQKPPKTGWEVRKYPGARERESSTLRHDDPFQNFTRGVRQPPPPKTGGRLCSMRLGKDDAAGVLVENGA